MEDYLVYIVDDEYVNRMILKEGFKGKYRVKEAESGAELFELIEEDLPDIILLDIMMPGMDGKEVCKKLKKIPRTHDIPVIFITALSEMEDKKNGLEIGAVDYIVKPFDLAEVRLRVQQQLKMRELYLKVKKQNKKVKKDILAARKIQLNLLPYNKQSVFDKYDFFFEYFPCDSLGGDFIDFFKLSDNKVLFYLSDVSGHGISSSLVTIFVKQFFNSLVGEEKYLEAKPSVFLKDLNKALIDLDIENKYLTIFLGIINLDDDIINWTSAGPNTKPYILRKNKIEILENKDLAIGWFDDVDWNDKQMKLEKGDSLVLYSDAAIELHNEKKEMLGISGFKELFVKADFRKERDFESIVGKLLDYSENIRFDDDLTLMGLHKKD